MGLQITGRDWTCIFVAQPVSTNMASSWVAASFFNATVMYSTSCNRLAAATQGQWLKPGHDLQLELARLGFDRHLDFPIDEETPR